MPPKQGKSSKELEQKISLSRKDLEAVFNALSKGVDKAAIRHKYMPRQYYDTQALDLHRLKMSLRVQYVAGKRGALGGYEQTVKFDLPANSNVNALSRQECKDMLPGPQPDIAAVTDAGAKSRLAPVAGKKLKHIFTAAVERRYFTLSAGRGKNTGTVEVAFDVGEVFLPSSGARHPFAEIELEIKSGNPAAIAEISAQILQLASAAKVQPLTKAEQGVKLYLAARRSR